MTKKNNLRSFEFNFVGDKISESIRIKNKLMREMKKKIIKFY